MADKRDEMIRMAQAALQQAYAPYSNHPVGAAILADDGQIYAGCNVENAAYPLGSCAESTAIGAMIMAGAKRIEHVVVVGPKDQLCPPCGGCRQKIREFAGEGDVPVTLCAKDGIVLLETTSSELLPHSFGPANVDKV